MRTTVPFSVLYAVVILAPLLQFALIRLRTHRLIYWSIPFALASCAPVMFDCEPFRFFGILTCFNLFNFLRITDVALQHWNVVYSWSLSDYYEYFFTFYTRQQRSTLKAQGKRAGSPFAVMPEDRHAGYYGRFAWKMLVQYTAYHLLAWYAEAYPPNRDPPVRRLANIFDLKEMTDNFVFGLTLCLLLSISKFFVIFVSS